MQSKKKQQKYWYKFIVTECPLCGRGGIIKERVYDKPKPKDLKNQYHYIESYDYCDVL